MRRLGLAAASVQLALAFMFGVLVGQRPFPNPPEEVPRSLALVLLFAQPAVIGAIGALAGRRSIVLAGAFLSTMTAFVGFGTTLVFLVPAMLYAMAAAGAGEPRRRPVSPSRLLVFILVAIPVAAVAVLTIGLLAVPTVVVVVAALAAARNARPWTSRVSARRVTTAVAIVLLGVGSGWVLLAMTGTRCWVAYGTPDQAVYKLVPDTNQIDLPNGAIAGGCNSGELTARGALIAAGLAGAAIGLATVSASAVTRLQRPAA